MTWPAYPRYRASGVDWLGNVPESWPLMPVKRRFSVTVGKMLNAGTASDEGEAVPYLRAGNVQPNGLDLAEVKYIKLTTAERNALDLRKGDLVVVEGGAGYGRSACLQEDLSGWAFQNHILRVRPTNSDSNRFLDYIIRTLNSLGHIAALSNHATIPSLSSEQLSRIVIPIPDIATQRTVVTFLDHETAKIDTLIAKQEQLIATLREDRTATITHAVTRGLDPDAEMKDFGIGWFGEVPAHWSVPQIGMHAAIGNGSTPSRENPAYWNDGTVPWLNSGHVNSEEITEADQFVTELALRECHLPLVSPRSVLVGLTGQGKTRGMASILLARSTINQHLAYLTPTDRRLDGHYLQRVLGSAYRLLRDISDENGSTKGGLTCAALRKVRIPLPPLHEQREIVEFLNVRCGNIDVLIAKANEVIETLREYRSALITDAVTGKIDVRGAA